MRSQYVPDQINYKNSFKRNASKRLKLFFYKYLRLEVQQTQAHRQGSSLVVVIDQAFSIAAKELDMQA